MADAAEIRRRVQAQERRAFIAHARHMRAMAWGERERNRWDRVLKSVGAK